MSNIKRERLAQNKISLPDCLFSDYVEKEYGINRGVYNTIDLWFYKNGLKDLFRRRKEIINFLHNVHETSHLDNKRLKFGHGGLSKKLTDYWERIYNTTA